MGVKRESGMALACAMVDAARGARIIRPWPLASPWSFPIASKPAGGYNGQLTRGEAVVWRKNVLGLLRSQPQCGGRVQAV